MSNFRPEQELNDDVPVMLGVTSVAEAGESTADPNWKPTQELDNTVPDMLGVMKVEGGGGGSKKYMHFIAPTKDASAYHKISIIIVTNKPTCDMDDLINFIKSCDTPYPCDGNSSAGTYMAICKNVENPDNYCSIVRTGGNVAQSLNYNSYFKDSGFNLSVSTVEI